MVVRERDQPERLGEIAAGVLGARTLLAIAFVIPLAVAQMLIPVLADLGWLLWLGVIWFLGMAFRPVWFFLGMERMGKILGIEVALRIFAVGTIFWLVRSPNDAWLVLALQGSAFVLSAAIGWAIMYRSVPFRFPTFSRAFAQLKNGWNLFVFRASTTVYSMSNTIILGFLAAPAVVGYYGAAERIVRILTSLMFPIVQAMYPRASEMIGEDPHSAGRITRISTIALFGSATVASLVLYATVPYLVRILLGADYADTVPVLRIMLILLPLLGINLPLSSQWIIPVGLESALTKITISAGVIHIPLAIMLGSAFAAIGMAWTVVITETYITLMIIAMLALRGHGVYIFHSHVPSAKSPQ